MDLNSIEEQIKKPGYLLFVVTALILLIIGWVNLISVESETPSVFNMYSIPQTIFILVYTVFTLGWARLLWRPNDDEWLLNFFTKAQNKPIIGLAVLGVASIILASMFIPSSLHDIWLFHPALEAAVIIFFLMLVIFIVVFRAGDASRPTLWKYVGYLLIVVVGVEILLQAASFLGLSPLTTSLAEAVGPYDRIYYVNGEGETTNAFANEFGWHYPEFRLEEESHVVAVLGDAHIKGYGVPAEENIGVVLDRLLNSNDQIGLENPEAISLGFPDLGTGLFLSDTTVEHNRENYEFDETIIFFDIGSDFQVVTEPSDEAFYYYRDGDDVVIDERSWGFRHDAAHYTLWGSSDGFKPNRSLNSHIMLSRLVQRGIKLNDTTSAKVPAPQEDVALPNSFVFYEETDDDAQFIVKTQLTNLNEKVYAPRDLTLNFVTIPAFTDKFYAQAGSDWSTEFGDADLFLPERELRAHAADIGISFLAMGEYLRASGLSTADVQALFMDEGRGYFTAEGHAFFAQAAYECFYEKSLDSSFGCDLN
ncbi:MAG: hypothetical protein AB8G95_29445 [Anaerolineae bacterium]